MDGFWENITMNISDKRGIPHKILHGHVTECQWRNVLPDQVEVDGLTAFCEVISNIMAAKKLKL